MLLLRVWQTVYNRIFRVRQMIVHIYFHAFNRIRVGQTRRVGTGFTVCVEFKFEHFFTSASRTSGQKLIFQ
jgi:hypothetical protein